MANQGADRFRGHWGSFASIAQLPNTNTAGVQSDHLAVGDVAYVASSLYVCTVATRSGATWVQIGAGGGGGPRQLERVGDLSTSNYYTNSNLAWQGANNFFASGLIYPWNLPGTVQSLFGNLIAANLGGWALALGTGPAPAALQFTWSFFDGGANLRQMTAFENAMNAAGGGMPTLGKLYHVAMAVYQNGAVTDARMWVNGGAVATFATGAQFFSTSSDSFRVGATPEGTPALGATGTEILGVGVARTNAQYGTDFTDEDVRDHFETILTAGAFVDFAAAPYDAYVVADGLPVGAGPATWDNAEGTAARDLTRTGSPTVREAPELWG